MIPPAGLVPLNQIAVPRPPNLYQFVKDNAAAVRLGKALFWDMQVGSDGITACASCHFNAGADNRVRNAVHPGPGNVWEAVSGPDQTIPMDSTVFPFHQRSNPDLQSSAVTRDFHDIVGSPGIRLSDFTGVVAGNAVDGVVSSTIDPVFTFGGQNVRQVTRRNTPSVINAVFNFNNLWDGRAHFIFNGENPFGPADTSAGIWYHNAAPGATTLAKKKVSIEFASLASQAVGPLLNDVEMSARGRIIPEIGRKMFSLVPLGKQLVHPGDSALGFLSRATKYPDGTVTGFKGLTGSYTQMLKSAFQDNLWDSPQNVTLNTSRGPVEFTQMEANFPLFWGLALQAYMATLVADQTPFDRFLGGENAALTDQQKLGFAIFQGIGNCTVCHGGTEMSNIAHSVIAFANNADNATLELMFVADGTQVLYDSGFNNTGVTPIDDDIGRGADTPFTNPLSVPPNQPIPLNFSRLAQLQALGQLPFVTPMLPIFIPPDFTVNTRGLFKVPGLRNVELTAPYFHNGGARTLEEVVEFYVRGGNFPIDNVAELDPAVMGGIPFLQGDPARKSALVAFLKSLTDPRVVAESAPFDHPELFVPEGEPEVLIRIPARDAVGTAAAPLNLTLNEVVTPTNVAAQTVSGTVQAGMTVPQVSVNGGVPVSATVNGINWSAAVTGLKQGDNSITVTAFTTPSPGVRTSLTATIELDSIPPALTMNPVASPIRTSSQTLSGTLEAGAKVDVTVNGAAAAPATVSETTWSYTVSALSRGSNAVSVVATDAAGNTSVPLVYTINLLNPNGSFSGGEPVIADVIKALRIALGIVSPTADEMFIGDVVPPNQPDGKIDITDALWILKKVAGL